MGYSVVLLKKAEEFLDILEPKLAAKAFREIELLKEIGPMLSFPHIRKIEGTEKIYELRVKQGSNICRLFYFSKGKMIFIITSGYIKKTTKTDKEEIKRAIRLMNEYLEENDEYR
jgi:phage-related protein